MTESLHLTSALTPEGWRRDVRVSWAAGVITAVEVGVAAQASDERQAIGVPGIANLHSHAFQRAMSGFAERRGPGDDSFWSWRELMYRFALKISPGQAEAVAAQAYVEMLETGFTRVGEFHYLHHAPDGRHYDEIGEMSARIGAAAEQARIGLTLLPVFYAHSGFGGAPPSESQRQFLSNRDGYARLVERASAVASALDGGNIGLAPHSLRAVAPDELTEVAELAGAAPLHIHVAEQVAEVDACLEWSRTRPVQYLLDHAAVDRRWCLIHATHMTSAETLGVVAAGATVGLCPITEANLGDGIFDAPEFLAAGGKFGVGTDSNVQIALADELRTLEYGQRLARRARNVIAAPEGSTGRALFDHAHGGGGAALGRARTGLVVGADADIVTFREDRIGRDGDAWLDAWIFSRDVAIADVFARGRAVVRDGEHMARGRIADRFRATMRELLAR